MAKIKAVIFDMDGVLVDAREWHYESLNRALGHFGYTISRSDHLLTFDGLPTKKKLKMLSAQSDLPEGLHGLLSALKQKFTMQIIYQSCAPCFAHQYALSELKRAGMKLAVASNSIRATVQAMMSQTQLDQYLEFQLSNEDVLNGKPSPDIYLKAIDKLALEPDECLIVEDNPHGIAAAKGSGAYVLEVAGPEQVTLNNILSKIDEVEENR